MREAELSINIAIPCFQSAASNPESVYARRDNAYVSEIFENLPRLPEVYTITWDGLSLMQNNVPSRTVTIEKENRDSLMHRCFGSRQPLFIERTVIAFEFFKLIHYYWRNDPKRPASSGRVANWQG
jgi:hypothetical protein